MMNEILARHTGQDVEAIARDTDRDNIMSPEEAKSYGLIDAIVEPRKLRSLGAFVPSVPAASEGNGAKH
jgi:ATP-dependent protease ClpP protease subunit